MRNLYLGWFIVAASFVLGEDDLKRWSNSYIEVIRTLEPVNGLPLILALVPLFQDGEGIEFVQCRVTIPTTENGDVSTFVVQDGFVFDSEGEVVTWLEQWDDNGRPNACGVRILEKLAVHDDTFGGCFTIETDFQGDGSRATIGAVLHIEDEQLTSITGADKGEHIHPEKYSLRILPDLLSRSPVLHYAGVVQTRHRIDAGNTGSSVSFHMEGLDIVDFKLFKEINPDEDLEELLVTRFIFDFQKTTLLVSGPEGSFPNPGEGTLITEIKFEANIDPDDRFPGYGLYKVPCIEGSDKYCWFTQFQSTGARWAFPCRDEPDEKAQFELRILRKDGWTSLSNMPILSSTPHDGEGFPDWAAGPWIQDNFAPTVTMSPYLVAIAIHDFSSIAGPDNVTVWAPQADIEAGYGDFSATYGARVLQFFGETFGIEYTLPKMDMMSVPGKLTAMENWGLSMYNREALLLDEVNCDIEERWAVVNIEAHELAHQWTGNLVTMTWWDQLWLNEGFAVWLSHLACEQLEPSIHSWAWLLVRRVQKALKIDATSESWALTDPVTSRSDIHRKFGELTYSKGGGVIRMMEMVLGREALVTGLSTYLEENQYGNTVEDQLFAHLEAAGVMHGRWPQDGVSDFGRTMKTWTDQAGFPLLRASRTTEGQLWINQTWFTNQNNDGEEKLWHVPITWVEVNVTDWEDSEPKTWMTKQSITLEAENFASTDSLVLLNTLAVGYYRVHYDQTTWAQISEQLRMNHKAIHPLQRAAIICDVVSLAEVDLVSKEVMEAVLAFRDQEEDFAPLMAFRECVDDMVAERETS